MIISADSASSVDPIAVQRLDTMCVARSILGQQYDGRGKSIEAIRREVIVHIHGEAATRDWSDDFIHGAFTATAYLAAMDPATRGCLQ